MKLQAIVSGLNTVCFKECSYVGWRKSQAGRPTDCCSHLLELS